MTKVYMNLGIPNAIEKYKKLPFDGIGLMRIEFTIASVIRVHPFKLIQQKREEIYVEKLAKAVGDVAKAISPRPVVVRFSDLKTNEYRNLEGGEEFEPIEQNPMMGWRGASRYISGMSKYVFLLEARAIRSLRTKFDNIWIMIPFVRTIEEAKACLELLKREELKSGVDLKIWLMAEVPSIALMIDKFNELDFDGYSIGSNDLCQFVLGVDRDNSRLLKMGYFNEKDPAVIKMMEMIVEGSHRGGKTCSICGESVSNYEEIARRLINLDIDSISVNPHYVVSAKKLVSNLKRAR